MPCNSQVWRCHPLFVRISVHRLIFWESETNSWILPFRSNSTWSISFTNSGSTWYRITSIKDLYKGLEFFILDQWIGYIAASNKDGELTRDVLIFVTFLVVFSLKCFSQSLLAPCDSRATLGFLGFSFFLLFLFILQHFLVTCYMASLKMLPSITWKLTCNGLATHYRAWTWTSRFTRATSCHLTYTFSRESVVGKIVPYEALSRSSKIC